MQDSPVRAIVYRVRHKKQPHKKKTSMIVAIAASQMQAKLPARVKVDKITY